MTGLDRTDTASGKTSQSVPIPMLLSSSSSAPNLETQAPLQPTQWRQRIVHTRTFKIYEYGNGPAELVVEEVDSSGHSHGRSLEYFFNGIVGHVRDQHGKQVDGWHQAAQLANYWRRHFGVPRKIPIHTMITIPMTGLCNGCESSHVTNAGPNRPARLATTQHSVPGSSRQ